jgi:hypothetical protein
MLDVENIEPRKLAYDRPSEKLLNFLSRHYQLKNYVSQNNNFVVYKAYFENLSLNSNRSVLQSYKNNNFENSNILDEEIYQKKKVTNLNNKFNNLAKRKFDKEDEDDIVENFNKIDINSKITVSRGNNYNNTCKEKEDFSYLSNKNSITKNEAFNTPNLPNSEREINQKENYKSTKYNTVNSNPPWATYNASNNFAPSSSSYGSYYAVKKNTNY